MTAPAAPRIDVRHAADRFHTVAPGLESWHCFSFGGHHDTANIHFGLLLANNEERVASGSGFASHAHREIDIVTWVLSGSLVHEDSAGHGGVIGPCVGAVLSAGTGITHTERADPATPGVPVHFVQMWVAPGPRGLAASYEQFEVDGSELAGRLRPIASGLAAHAGSGAIRLSNPGAGFSVARLDAGESVDLPDAPFVHLFLAGGSALAEGSGPLGAGDAVRYRDAGGCRVTAIGPAQLLVWQMLASAFE